MRYLSTFLCILVLAAGPMVSAQDHPFYVYGEVWDLDTRNILLNTTITATNVEDTTHVIEARIDSKGRYDLELPFDHTFKVEFKAPGYLSKHVLMELQGVDPKHRNGDHGMNVQAALIKPMGSVDYDPLTKKAFAICRLNKKGKSFVWDDEYNALNAEAFQAVLESHGKRRQELGL